MKRDVDTVAIGNLSGLDTVITDLRILQTETYTYRAYRMAGSKEVDESEPIEVTIGHGWTVDTLKNPYGLQLVMDQSWGFADGKVLAVGHDRALWEWDGKRWAMFQTNPADYFYGQGIRDFYGVWGIDENNFWVVGWRSYPFTDTTGDSVRYFDTDSSFIGHWDGTHWTIQDAYGGRPLFYIWGSSETDIYAGGWWGSLFHYDGTVWHKIAPNDTTMYYDRIWGRSSSEVYCIGARLIPPYGSLSWKYLLRLTPMGYSILDSTYDAVGNLTRFGTAGIWGTQTKTYSWGTGLYEKSGDSWNLIFNPQYQLADVKGVSDQSLYAVGLSGSVYLYDGESWNRPAGLPYIPPAIDLASVWLNSSEVFILGYDGWYSYVYHYK